MRREPFTQGQNIMHRQHLGIFPKYQSVHPRKSHFIHVITIQQAMVNHFTTFRYYSSLWVFWTMSLWTLTALLYKCLYTQSIIIKISSSTVTYYLSKRSMLFENTLSWVLVCCQKCSFVFNKDFTFRLKLLSLNLNII